MFLGAIEWFCIDSGQRDGMIMSDIWLLNNETEMAGWIRSSAQGS